MKTHPVYFGTIGEKLWYEKRDFDSFNLTHNANVSKKQIDNETHFSVFLLAFEKEVFDSQNDSLSCLLLLFIFPHYILVAFMICFPVIFSVRKFLVALFEVPVVLKRCFLYVVHLQLIVINSALLIFVISSICLTFFNSFNSFNYMPLLFLMWCLMSFLIILSLSPVFWLIRAVRYNIVFLKNKTLVFLWRKNCLCRLFQSKIIHASDNIRICCGATADIDLDGYQSDLSGYEHRVLDFFFMNNWEVFNLLEDTNSEESNLKLISKWSCKVKIFVIIYISLLFCYVLVFVFQAISSVEVFGRLITLGAMLAMIVLCRFTIGSRYSMNEISNKCFGIEQSRSLGFCKIFIP